MTAVDLPVPAPPKDSLENSLDNYSPTTEVTSPCLPDLLRQAVAARPGALAVVVAGSDEQLTFAELDARSAAVAACLRGVGVDTEDRVGLFVAASADLVAATWGILRAGAAYLPLSPDYPDDRLRHMITDARPTALWTTSALRGRLAALVPPGVPVLTSPDADAAAAAGLTADPAVRLRPDNLAYVIHTSGSTGTPKGVMIEHRSIVNQLRWLQARHDLDAGRVVLQKTPMSFDAAQWEMLASACGATIVVAEPGTYREPERLVDAVVRHGVTTLQCVPTLWQALLDTDRLGECTSLRQAFSGGEALSRELAREVLQALPDCSLVNLYGPTECTINTSSHTVDPEELAEGPLTVPIGLAAGRTRHYILDAAQHPVAEGEVGELYVAGVQLARGYLNRPDLTTQRFLTRPTPDGHGWDRLYRTGDLASWNPDGTASFVGRVDNQVKLRGYRVELDEIRSAVEAHDWVRHAGVVVRTDGPAATPQLVAYVELDPKEAALMDQGRPADHHRSKGTRLQIRAQLSNPGCRDDADLAGRPAIDLPGAEPTPDQVRDTFARKTYRFFEGGPVTRGDLIALLDRFAGRPGTAAAAGGPGRDPGRDPGQVPLAEWGRILRRFGQFSSPERLLPKYGWASPGALYAVQLHLETRGVDGLPDGVHYYHPVTHRLVLVRSASHDADGGPARVAVHLVGRPGAIEPVYAHNVQEVLEFEAGHLVGLLDQVLPAHGLQVAPAAWSASTADLDAAPDDVALGSFALVPLGTPGPTTRHDDPVEIYVQAHPGRVPDLAAGQYRHRPGTLERISDDLVLQRHVIAVNQHVYARSSFGISLVCREPGDGFDYLELGRRLHRLQANDLGLGMMSSGYSSRSGHPLPAARRIAEILAGAAGTARQAPGPDDASPATYFCVGGRVSPEQIAARGMAEDAVHMKGPTEIIREDLVRFLPDYMMPSRVTVLDALPLTANGKIDTKALLALPADGAAQARAEHIEPRTPAEARVAAIWRQVMQQDDVSVRDDFFTCGGDSLLAVGLVNRLNRELGAALPLQVLFEAPTVEHLARRIEAGEQAPPGRLVPLRSGSRGRPVFCWPGLGGYPMNLGPLARRLRADRPVVGVQAFGINPGEVPDADVASMARRDVAALRAVQPHGPYTLWGYSFGARIAFESAWQLEQAGEQVDQLFLIAPGSPLLPPQLAPASDCAEGSDLGYLDPAFLAILLSVFTGTIDAAEVTDCLRTVADAESFVTYAAAGLPHLGRDVIRRIVRVVERTYRFEYRFEELDRRRISAPVTVFRARGDDYSFLDRRSGWSCRPPATVDLDTGHYGLLRDPGVAELAARIDARS